ncbi:probable proline iminopeptidase [Patiria miniata]|uniref:Proline iminopeptidase n=1 Tax=Patiria miniata TaxID=46514 RepID=A0A913Z1W1_PATMI|nr:probable proline iminopeptidase [Patiria miniata]
MLRRFFTRSLNKSNVKFNKSSRNLGRNMAETSMYPPIEPYDTGRLKVDDIHELYYEQSGKPDGNPILFVHGGPGGGSSPADRCYFDPQFYRIVIFDQRGSGKSTPAAELRNNTSWHLVKDIETVREHLKIDQWVIFGGSWGATLSLLYAEIYTKRVKAMVLRGVFTFQPKEIKWLYQEGASYFYPDHWDSYISVIPEEERGDLVTAYHKRLTGDDEDVKMTCARAWSLWECSVSKLVPDKEAAIKVTNDLWVTQFARIESHYMINRGFLESDRYILDNAIKLKDIPCSIVQGRYDIVCPPESAFKLHQILPKSELHFLIAGHFSKEPLIQESLVKSTDKYKTL